MIIGVDGNEANTLQPVGVSVYTRELLRYFQSVASAEQRFEIYLKSTPLADLPAPTDYFRYVVVTPKRLWSYLSLPLYFLSHPRPDVLFCPAHYSPRFNMIPLVVTIHDLAYKYFPNEFRTEDRYKLERWTAYSLKKARAIITVSNHTRQDLVAQYPETEPRTTVVPNGFRRESFKQESLPKQFDLIKKKYILCVATFQPRKNLASLVRAFELFSNQHPDYKLLLIGKKGWMYQDTLTAITTSPVKNNIIICHEAVPRPELSAYYHHAFTTVLPSLYEGFGLPILEAFSNDGNVIASSVSSMPEVGGNAALYCDPQDPQTIVDQLERLFDRKVLASLKAARVEQLKKFSWDKCAEQTLEIIKSVAHEA